MNEDVISENLSAQHIATGDDSYNCNQCDFSSVHARALRIHMKIHTMGKTNKYINATLQLYRQVI